jgi:adenine deaminase
VSFDGACVIRASSADVLKVAVLGRHSDHGGVGRGFVKRLRHHDGRASPRPIGHDSHNICVIGCNGRGHGGGGEPA